MSEASRPSAPSAGSRRRATLACAGLAAALLALAPAHAADDPCLASFEETQILRQQGQFRAARDAAKRCASERCKPALRDECVQWHAEIERLLPSVVIEARSPRGEESEVAVVLDGKPLVDRLDGSPLEVDPGMHTFLFQHRDFPVVERKVVVKAGDKLRPLTILFEAPAAPPPPASTSLVAPPPPPPAPRPVSWGLLGLSAASFGAFAALAWSAGRERDELASSCAPFCTGEQVNRVRNRYLLADLSLGVGLASLGAAVYLYARRPAPAPGLAVSLSPRRVELGYRKEF